MRKLRAALCVVLALFLFPCFASAVEAETSGLDLTTTVEETQSLGVDEVTPLPPEAIVTPPFMDVPNDHPYVEAIRKAKEAKYANGTGDGNFHPDRSVSAYETSILLQNIFPTYGYAKDKDIQSYGYLVKPGLKLNHAQVATLVLRAINATPYNVKLWNEAATSNLETDSYNAAYQDGIMACGHSAYDEISRGEVVNFMLTMQERGLNLELPEWYQRFNITEDKTSELDDALFDMKLVPEPVLQLFIDKEWTIHLGREYIEEWSKNNNDFKAAALTSYKKKTCFIGTTFGIPHELGHFLEYQLRDGTNRITFTKAERLASEKVLGKYATSNDLEYFAEYFAFWVRNKTDAKKMNLLKDITPETYAYFEALEANNWVRPQ